MRAKYGKSKEDLDLLRPIQGSSFTWASFSKAANLLRKGCAWNIKNGRHTKFWLDVWVLQVPLKDVAMDTIPEDLENARVADFVTEDGLWRTELFADLLPFEVLGKILSIVVDKLSVEEDTMFWSAAAYGRFSVKTAYSLLNQRSTDPDEKYWRILWRLPVLERVRSFMWMLLLDKVATKLLLFHRKVAENPFCLRCEGCPETALHILRDCPPPRLFWTRGVPGHQQHLFFNIGQGEWLRHNLSNDYTMDSSISWATFFSIAVWLIWKNRCMVCFQGIGAALSPPYLAHLIWRRPNFGMKLGERPPNCR
ncbi:unnamed protein product [Linum trigynum]|uniref:Reverse transcriptase zinc-binding domain-containing protein n=1 Tax=Linum trigynum TaxID=586398 RepID=A0AAV2CPY2_9ROSI